MQLEYVISEISIFNELNQSTNQPTLECIKYTFECNETG